MKIEHVGRKILLFIVSPGAVLLILAVAVYLSPKVVSDTSLSGNYYRDQIWNGEITITGDVYIRQALTIRPGTTIKFLVQDDRARGTEIMADGFNNDDPTRLESYATSHSSLEIGGNLTARGTKEQPITFTSAAETPTTADWEAVYIHGPESIVEYAIVDYSRNGLTPTSIPGDHVIIQNNSMHSNFWSAVSTGYSSAQVLNNEIYESGHEGIDSQGGSPTIIGNYIYHSNTGIVIMSGGGTISGNVIQYCGNGIYTEEGASPTVSDNSIEYPVDNSTKEWRYNNEFTY